MRRRAIVGTLAAIAATTALGTGTGAGIVSAAADDGDERSELAEAQFRVYLLTNTDLRPSDITCTLPPIQNSDGEMLCFALVGRDSIAAVATLVEPGVYTFTAVTKAGTGTAPQDDPQSPPPAPQPAPAPAPQPAPDPQPAPAPEPGNQSPADLAVLDAVATLVEESDAIGEQLMENNPAITSIDPITYDETTSTVSVSLTTDITDPADRDFTAFDVTNTLAFLWESDWPLRDPEATIQPRAEVIVDGEIYGTPYDVMVRVADYDIEFEEWISITTTGGAVRKPEVDSAVQAADHRAEVLRKGEPADSRRSLFA